MEDQQLNDSTEPSGQSRTTPRRRVASVPSGPIFTETLVPLDVESLELLREAKETLESRGLADRLTELIGAPIMASVKMLPDVAERAISKAVEKSLRVALDVAVSSLGKRQGGAPRLWRHKIAATVTGAAGGAFGMAAVAAELPMSTAIILRSVADIARSEGEDLTDLEARLACLEVFAIGPDSTGVQLGDETQVGYFAIRAALGKQISSAADHLVRRSAADTMAPPLVRLVSMIGKRFGVVVSEKVAAQAVPVVGAIGGALINSYFIDHYQDLARAHFTIRRLERQFGETAVQEAYRNIKIED